MSLQPGTLISERLRLANKIAEGGMGSIWVAGANIAAAFVTAALLLRNQPSRSNP